MSPYLTGKRSYTVMELYDRIEQLGRERDEARARYCVLMVAITCRGEPVVPGSGWAHEWKVYARNWGAEEATRVLEHGPNDRPK